MVPDGPENPWWQAEIFSRDQPVLRLLGRDRHYLGEANRHLSTRVLFSGDPERRGDIHADERFAQRQGLYQASDPATLLKVVSEPAELREVKSS